jgi:hypothetical protein
MKKLNLIWFLMLLAIVLVCTSFLVDAQADDTYNFYFQKAPGPTVVNQGVMGQSSGPNNTPLPNQGPAPVAPAAAAPASAASVASSAPAPTESSSGPLHKWEFSVGLANDFTSTAGFGEGPAYAGPVLHGQFMAGLQMNAAENFGLEANGYYLKDSVRAHMDSGPKAGQDVAMKANRFDWSAGLVITPVRVAPGSPFAGLSFSGLAGFGSAPVLGITSAADPYSIEHPDITHKTTPYFGGRVALELGSKVALQATLKRYTKFDMTKGTASVALLF